ncbi:hypothetical protein NM208_g538 [Fusarium decemcellulare]|uniref:Uncharacterized protein n=2 Tax=Fusarium decemcellulare TaxID=57161 RepID=A0ACC1SAY6_9HYPO|nr:hypothetical protein NM208_g7096 [Fusarium decemcellulare]KAJ3549376.1 hypothetical protein NM208_g538 [Fusarium decemcellulare]
MQSRTNMRLGNTRDPNLILRGAFLGLSAISGHRAMGSTRSRPQEQSRPVPVDETRQAWQDLANALLMALWLIPILILSDFMMVPDDVPRLPQDPHCGVVLNREFSSRNQTFTGYKHLSTPIQTLWHWVEDSRSEQDDLFMRKIKSPWHSRLQQQPRSETEIQRQLASQPRSPN